MNCCLECMLLSCSSKDTAWPVCAHLWSEENPATAHCVMYALYVQEMYGGSLQEVAATYPNGTAVVHYRNIIGGVTKDFSSSQFPEGM